MVSDVSNSRYKAGGINFVNGRLYWISDSNGPKPYDRGVFRCDPADLTHPDKHTRLFNPDVESACMIIQDGTILAAHCAPASPLNTGFIVFHDEGAQGRSTISKNSESGRLPAFMRKTVKVAVPGEHCNPVGSSMPRWCSSSRSPGAVRVDHGV